MFITIFLISVAAYGFYYFVKIMKIISDGGNIRHHPVAGDGVIIVAKSDDIYHGIMNKELENNYIVIKVGGEIGKYRTVHKSNVQSVLKPNLEKLEDCLGSLDVL